MPKPAEPRYYAYSPTRGRARAPDEYLNEWDDLYKWAAARGYDNLTYVEGPLRDPTVAKIVWRRDTGATHPAPDPDLLASIQTVLAKHFPYMPVGKIGLVAREIAGLPR